MLRMSHPGCNGCKPSGGFADLIASVKACASQPKAPNRKAPLEWVHISRDFNRFPRGTDLVCIILRVAGVA